MGLWTRCPKAADCGVKLLELEKKERLQTTQKDKDQPCVFGSLQHKYVFEAFPVETYKKKVQLFTLINRAVSVALAVLDACWTMQ